MKHFVRVGILTTILTVLIGSGLDNLGLMPVLASVQGAAIDALFRKHIWVISFLFSLIIGFMLYSFVVFRRKPGEEGDGDHFEGHTSLEIAWTIVPLGIVMYFSFLGASALAETRRADPNAYNITIVGSQWSWRFDYTDYDFSSTELRLPIDRQSLLTLTSTDVIHSFWVPEFRLKQDALPGEGMERELRITPTLLGDYKLRCAELCGLEHAYMVSDVIVMEVDDFEEWVEEQIGGPSGDAAARGEEWTKQFGCVACHSTDGAERIGPTWFGLYESEETLVDGSTITVDDDYLFESILDPQATIVEGYDTVIMPPTGESMTEEQILDIVEYIESLTE
ncbi:MAG: cytochrome c oxidase subunit II [Anaerolineae bacterium]|jgi:cytochrome c oxidase subunit II|nr:cytochrome c oxidase subunit II [Anaerolineae bacterium]MBT3714005.1 cytochrome c oxidase subunit II [Anaerolineae bacterium]MBT4311047.1 cytochrome c oxidase subunit II [Anaerolineae bacterium]MBT4459897.1 cytochrome c oxidase subunit II [Anaerolineae bacterium]MBT4841782.1 cytochrome c oxidase subunit II [Anaerolineae bacterium]